MDKASRSLQVLSEIANVYEAVGGVGGIHKEIWRGRELDGDAAHAVGVAFGVFELNSLYVRKRVLDLVAGLFCVNVVGHGGLRWRGKDDEIH